MFAVAIRAHDRVRGWLVASPLGYSIQFFRLDFVGVVALLAQRSNRLGRVHVVGGCCVVFVVAVRI